MCMRKAFRRGSGRIRSASLNPPSSLSSLKKAIDSRPVVAPSDKFARDNVGPTSNSILLAHFPEFRARIGRCDKNLTWKGAEIRELEKGGLRFEEKVKKKERWWLT